MNFDADNLPPLSLYLHFPWCVAKCPYCDFNSHALSGELPAADYVSALIAELNQQPQSLMQRPLVSIFLGGGTPSLFPPDEMQRLLNEVRSRFTLAPDCEITMEANPGALEHAAFGAYRSAGINRLSLGVQSFSDAALVKLGRVHNSADVYAAYSEARKAGFDNINLDVMYALPGQTAELAQQDIACAIALEPEHISCYHLTLEPNTVFYARPPAGLPDDDKCWDMQQAAAVMLESAGYRNYEVSAWGRPGRQSRHNLNYWNFGDYLGLGAGAHGKITSLSGVRRQRRMAHPRAYLENASGGNALVAEDTVTAAELVFEFMLNGMRLREGTTMGRFEAATGLPGESLEPALVMAEERGLLQRDGLERIRPTALGWRFLDDLQAIFLPPAQKTDCQE